MKKYLSAYKIPAIASVLLIAASFANAQVTIVSWGPTTDSVTSHQGIAINTTFDDSTYQSPAVGVNYNFTGAVANPDFYAAVSHTPSTSFNVYNGSNNDLIGRWQGAVTAGTVQSMMLAWDVTSTDTVDSFGIFGIGQFGGMVDLTLRYLVQDSSGVWFASNEISGFGNNANISTDAVNLTWVNYTPHTSGSVTFGSAATPSLTDVDKVGFYHQWTTDGGGGVYQTGFEVTAVPEPAMFALFAGIGALGLILYRRRK